MGALAAKPFVRGVGTTAAVRMAGVGLGMVGALVAARFAGPEAYGTFAYLNALITLLAIVVTFGGDTHTIQAARQESFAAPAFRAAVALMVLLGLVGLVLLVPLAAALYATGFFGEGRAALLTFTAILIAVPATWATRSIAALWRAQERPLPAEITGSIVPRLGLLAGVAGFWALGAVPSGAQLILSVAVVTAISIVIAALPVARRVLRCFPFRPHGRTARDSLRACGGHTLHAVAGVSFDLTPVILLGLLGRPVEAGVLSIAMRLFLPVAIINQSLIASLMPRVAKAMNAGGLDHRLRAALRWAALSTAGALLAYGLFVAAAGPLLLAFIGQAYVDALLPALILIAGRSATLLIGHAQLVLQMSGRIAPVAMGQGLSAATIAAAMLCWPDIPLTLLACLQVMGWLAASVQARALLRRRQGIVIDVWSASAGWPRNRSRRVVQRG
jgi:O-antigen/teichoic acid export membrane protein